MTTFVASEIELMKFDTFLVIGSVSIPFSESGMTLDNTN